MGTLIRLIETVEETNLTDFYFRMQIVGTKTKLNQALVPFLTTTGPAILTINGSMHDAMLLGFRGDSGELKLARDLEGQLRGIFKLNTRDVEKQTNILGDISLPGKFDCEIVGPKTPIVIADITVEWTQNIGEFKIRIKSHKGAKSFVLECTQLAEDDSIISVIERPMDYATDTLSGFVSGAKYMFRAYIVLPNKARTDWTGYFAIRAK